MFESLSATATTFSERSLPQPMRDAAAVCRRTLVVRRRNGVVNFSARMTQLRPTLITERDKEV